MMANKYKIILVEDIPQTKPKICKAEWLSGIIFLQHSVGLAEFPYNLVSSRIDYIRQHPLEALNHWGPVTHFEAAKSMLNNLYKNILDLSLIFDQNQRIVKEQKIINRLLAFFEEEKYDFRKLESDTHNSHQYIQASHINIAALNLLQLMTLIPGLKCISELKFAFESSAGKLLSEDKFRAPCVNNALAKMLTMYLLVFPNLMNSWIINRVSQINASLFHSSGSRLNPDQEFLRRLLINSFTVREVLDMKKLSNSELSHWETIYEEREATPPDIDFYAQAALSIAMKLYQV